VFIISRQRSVPLVTYGLEGGIFLMFSQAFPIKLAGTLRYRKIHREKKTVRS
jgi:hypothetical protein